MNEKDRRIIELENEIATLKRNQRNDKRFLNKYFRKTVLLGIKGVAGKNLYESVEDILSGKIDNESIATVLVNILYRFTRIGIFAVIIGLLPLSILTIQTIILNNQNEKLETQNRAIQAQTLLIESSRMTTYSNIVEKIIDDIDDEISSSSTISSRLINRMASMTQILRPYRFLDEDGEISDNPISPERAQLLLYLLNSKIDTISLIEIFNTSNFSYSDLRNGEYNEFYMKGINCWNCDFSGSKLANVNFHRANLSSADFRACDIKSVIFQESELSGGLFNNALISNSNLSNTNLQGIEFSSLKFINSKFDSAWVSESVLDKYLYINDKFTSLREIYNPIKDYEYPDGEKTFILIKK